MKAKKEDFTSIVGTLMKAGHKGLIINLAKPVMGALKAKKDYVWFPDLQIIMAVDTNTCYQLRRHDDTGWHLRINRKNPWYPVTNAGGGPEFEQLVEAHYIKHINNIMTGE